MGKLLLFPGVDFDPRTRPELVEEISEMMMKEVAAVFVEQRFEPGNLGAWHRQVRDYFWKQEIKIEERNFRYADLVKWKHYWRNQTLDFIRSRAVR